VIGRDRDAESKQSRKRTAEDFRVTRRVFREIRGWRRWVGVGLFLELLSTPLALLAPVSLAIVVDSAIGSEPLPAIFDPFLSDSAMTSPQVALVLACGLTIFVVLASQARSLAATLLVNRVGESITLSIRARLLTYALRLSFRFHDARGTADTIYRIQSDAPAIQFIALLGLIPFVTAIVTLVAMITIVARIDLQLAVVALAISPVLVVLTRVYRDRMKLRYRQVKKLESGSLRVVHEVFAAFRVIKAFGREQDEQERFTDESSVAASERVRVSVADGLFSLVISGVTALGTAIVLYIGVGGVRSGDMTTGALLLVVSYLGALYGPLQTISRQVGRLQGYLASAERVFELLDETPEVLDDPDGIALARSHGTFDLHGVSFAYEAGHEVLSDVDLHVPAGSRLGIVGRTGAGKSTLVGLLIRFYDVTSGRIELDGVDIRQIKLEDLRRQFSMVLQDPFLFSTSIAENIAYARPGASRDDIVAAATAAGIHEFIVSLPEGYETVVGERGMRLSGGERQRISIARAFLKDAPILLLDEPTSSVDVETEAGIMEAMDRLMVGRTTFMIAHRLSTLDSCDLVAEVEAGKVEIIRRGRVFHDIAASLPPAGDVHGRTTVMIAHRLSTLEKCDMSIRVEDGRCSVVDQQSNREPTAPNRTASTWPLYPALTWPLYPALTHSQTDLVPNTSSANASSTIPPGSTEADEARVGVGGDRSAALVTPKWMDSSAMRAGGADLLAEAVATWSTVNGERTQERLGAPLFKASKRPKRAVYRLRPVDGEGPSIVAKVARPEMVRLEETVSAALAEQGIRTPRLLGWKESRSGRLWLFQEDAGEELLDEESSAHRRLVAGWLGAVHAATTGARIDGLPIRDVTHYRHHVEHASLVLGMALDDEDIGERAEVVSCSLDALSGAERVWPEIERLAEGTRYVVTHGDLVPKNFRMQAGPQPTLLAFDWDTAGMGPPFVDLWWLWRWRDHDSSSTYLDHVDVGCSGPSEADVVRWAACGEIFRQAAALDWDSRSLEFRSDPHLETFVDKKVRNISLYADRLREAVRWLEAVTVA
jgi:ATP-binding cassette subfamily B protein